MLIIKRIAATAINVLIYLVALLLLKYILEISNVQNDDVILRLICYFLFILYPILYNSNGKTIGLFLLNITPNDKQRMLLKYLLYYVIYTGTIFSPFLFKLRTPDLNNQFSLTFIPSLLLSAITLSSACLLFFSGGRYNLLDSILNLKFNGKSYKQNRFLLFGIWLLLGYCFFIPLILIYKKNALTRFEGMIKDYNYQPSYFPTEIFDNYSDEQIIIDRKNVDDALMVSKEESFFHKEYITQRQISATLSKSTFLSKQKRLDLCIKLLHYQLNSMFTESAEKKVDQIKILLSYSQPINFFLTKNYTYEYYYEFANASKVYLYGGFDDNQLIKQYQNNLNTFYAYHDSTLANILNKPIDSLRNKKILLTKKQEQQYNNSLRNYQFGSITLSIVSPTLTEPQITYELNFSLLDFRGFNYISTFENNEKQYRHDSIINYRNVIDSILSN